MCQVNRSLRLHHLVWNRRRDTFFGKTKSNTLLSFSNRLKFYRCSTLSSSFNSFEIVTLWLVANWFAPLLAHLSHVALLCVVKYLMNLNRLVAKATRNLKLVIYIQQHFRWVSDLADITLGAFLGSDTGSAE